MEMKEKRTRRSEWSTLSFQSKMLLVFILINPIIDVITSIGKREFEISISLGIIVKGLFLMFMVLNLLLHKSATKFNKAAKIMIIVITIYSVIHVLLAYINFGLGNTVTVVTTLIKTFYLPVIILSLQEFIQREELPVIARYLFYVAIFIATIIAVAILTGTDYGAYKYNKLGTVGWFFAANEVSALLGILTPILMYYVLETGRLHLAVKTILMGLYIFIYYQIGTKVVALSVILTASFMIVLFIIRKARNRNLAIFSRMVAITAILLMAIVMVPVTPIGHNINVHSDIVDSRLDDAKEDSTEEQDYESIEDIEEDFINSDLSEREYRIASMIFSSRDHYFVVRKYIFDEAPVLNRVFGQTQFAETDKGEIKSYIAEIDFVDIYFNFGFAGSVLYWGIVLGTLGYALYTAARKKLIFITGSRIPYYICAILLGMGIALFAGHVFVSPAVSFYLGVVILLLYIEATEFTNDGKELQVNEN